MSLFIACPVCGRTYITEEQLYQHMQTAHPGVDPNQPKQCPRKKPTDCSTRSWRDALGNIYGSFDVIWKDTNILPDYCQSVNQWTGPITESSVKDWGKFVTFGAAPPGLPSQMETLILLVGLKKLSETPEGVKTLERIVLKYLDTVGDLITHLHLSSSSNFYTALLNTYFIAAVYQRLGLISPRDALQTRAWCDHLVAETIMSDRIDMGIGAAAQLGSLVISGTRGRSGRASAGDIPPPPNVMVPKQGA